MKMRALVINDEVRNAIALACARAKANPIPWAMVEAMAQKELKFAGLTLSDRRVPPGKRPPSQFVPIPIGYLAAISFEEQPAGLVRHLSVSVDASKQGKMPSPEAVEMIAKEFGFKFSTLIKGLELGEIHVWSEEFAPGERALNMVQIDKKREMVRA